MTNIIGHEQQITDFLAAIHSDRLHHAWLLAGPEGVGKGTFARHAAARLLAEAVGLDPGYPGLAISAESQTAHLIAAGSHPDYTVLERTARDSGELARNIAIGQVRDLQTLFATMPSYSSRRVVIIDAADDLERGAANALLKSLEEPPTGTIFLLITHAAGRLLPTIRSRCRVLRFLPLSDEAMKQVLEAQLPETGPEEIAALIRAGEGSPGRAMIFAGLDISGLDGAIDQLISTGDTTNAERSSLAKALSSKMAQARYEAFLQRVPTRISLHARHLAGPRLTHALSAWEEARTLSEQAVRRSLDREATAFALGSLLAGLAP